MGALENTGVQSNLKTKENRQVRNKVLEKFKSTFKHLTLFNPIVCGSKDYGKDASLATHGPKLGHIRRALIKEAGRRILADVEVLQRSMTKVRQSI